MVDLSAARKGHGLSGETLKLCALMAMLVDHATTALVEWPLRYAPAASRVRLDACVVAAHAIGRIAFPVFAFMVVEGLFHTHSRIRYLGRLLSWALMSEFPFDLALMLWPSEMRRGIWWDWAHQNVLFTLALGLCVIWALERLRTCGRCEGFCACGCVLGRLTAGMAVLGLGCLAAWFLRVDYGWYGVAAIVAAYLTRPTGKRGLAALAMLVPLALFNPFELWALLACPLLAQYDGTHGRGKVAGRHFYLFYPAHLLALGTLRLTVLPM